MRASIKASIIICASICLYQPSFAETDEELPKLLFNASASMLANTCVGCHGPDGVSSGPATPTISGMSMDYFIKQMENYKSGELSSTIMNRIAEGYTSKEIKLMAEFFAKKPFVSASGQKNDQILAKKGELLHKKYCEKCHSQGGSSVEEDAGILAGQWKYYLEVSMHDYIFGGRKAPKKMARKIKKLMDKEGAKGVSALIEFYTR